MSKDEKLKACFPYFGGKQKVAPVIWSRFGKIANYIEPFCGSLAVLLANPTPSKIETVNDKDYFIANFWRALSQDPESVIKFADYPVTEVDLHARHKWLVSSSTDHFRLQMDSDPEYYDPKIAGYWVWGISASIPGNWLMSKGINAMPILSSAGGGIHGLSHPIQEWLTKLSERLRRVRVCCGDWSKLLTKSVTYGNKGLSNPDISAVFLDPPYETENRNKVYKEESNFYKEVCSWAIQNGDNPKLRIAICGYENDYEFPDDWEKYSWSTNGGMANKSMGQSQGKDNSKREMIYFSPYCIGGLKCK